ncbi:hypothetical protein KY284_020209 [Solanum tuberosum]|nr:hypothetical protein KY284_020209 [Solanum tuberosum]
MLKGDKVVYALEVLKLSRFRNSNKGKGKSKSIDLDFPVHPPVTRSFSKNPNNLVPEHNTMGDEINSRFQEERVITETLMDSKLAAMEQRLGERIVQVIQEQFSSLGICSTKPVLHGAKSSNAQTIRKSTNPALRGNTLPIQPTDHNHQTSGNSNSTIPRYAKMDFPTYDGTYGPLIWAYRCEKFFKNQHNADAEKVGLAGFHLLEEAQLRALEQKQQLQKGQQSQTSLGSTKWHKEELRDYAKIVTNYIQPFTSANDFSGWNWMIQQTIFQKFWMIAVKFEHEDKLFQNSYLKGLLMNKSEFDKGKGKSKSIDLDFPVHRPVTRSFSKNPNNLVPEPNTMGDEISSKFCDEINSRFQEERVITETLMDSKPAAMEQRFGDRIVQVIQEQFSSLGIGSKKPVLHGAESSNAQTIGKSTNPAP